MLDLCLGSPDSPVCTGHCTVQCPVHRQPRAKFLFSCALSGGSPDIYCALSGVHRTATVDCPVCPSRVLKKKASSPTEPEALSFSQPAPALSVSGDSLLHRRRTPCHRRPPSPLGSGDLARALPLGEHLLLFPLSLLSVVKGCVALLPPPF